MERTARMTAASMIAAVAAPLSMPAKPPNPAVVAVTAAKIAHDDPAQWRETKAGMP